VYTTWQSLANFVLSWKLNDFIHWKLITGSCVKGTTLRFVRAAGIGQSFVDLWAMAAADQQRLRFRSELLPPFHNSCRNFCNKNYERRTYISRRGRSLATDPRICAGQGKLVTLVHYYSFSMSIKVTITSSIWTY
jgi:hypothetical protein